MVTKVKNDEFSVKFGDVGPLQETKLLFYNDASLGNLSDGVSSSCWYVVFITSEEKVCPLSWGSRKFRSTIAAEGIGLVGALEEAILMGSKNSDLAFPAGVRLPLHAVVDNKNLYNAIHSTTLVAEKLLRVDIAAIKPMLERG